MKLLKLCARIGVVMLAVMFGFAALATPRNAGASPVSVYECGGGGVVLGRSVCRGYFTNQNFYASNGGNMYNWDVLINSKGTHNSDRFLTPSGAQVANASEFIAAMKVYLSEGSASSYNSNAVGAAFIIDAMLNQSGSAFGGSWQKGYTTAEANLPNWEARVSFYDSQGWVKWDQKVYLGRGTEDYSHQCTSKGNVHSVDCGNPSNDYKDVAFTRNFSGATSPLIIFQKPGDEKLFYNTAGTVAT